MISIILDMADIHQDKNNRQEIKSMADDQDKHEIMTIEEAAEFLRMGKRSIYKLVKNEEIPYRKVLNKYRFCRSALQEWIKQGQ